MTTTFAPRPTIDRPRPHVFPTPAQFVTSTGITVEHFASRDRLITVALVTSGGTDTEPTGKEGVATLTAQLRKEGTQTFTGEQFAAELDRLGASLDTQVTDTVTVDTLRVPASGIADALALLRESAATPAFPAAEFERLRAEAVDRAGTMRADPGQRAEMALRSATFNDADRASLPRMGTAESLSTLTLGDVIAFAKASLIPSTATMVVGGDIGDDLAGLLTEAGFDDWKSDEILPVAGAAVASPSPRIVVVDRPGSVQTEIRLGTIASGPTSTEFAPLEIATHVLGGAFSSRLGVVLREEKGYTYGIQAFVQRLPERSRFLIATPVESSVTGEALDDIAAILHELRTDGLLDTERDNALDEMLLGGALRYQTAESLVRERVSHIGLGLPIGWLNSHRDALNRTSASDASNAFAAQVPESGVSAAFVGDAEQIVPHLARIWPDVPVSVEKL